MSADGRSMAGRERKCAAMVGAAPGLILELYDG